MKSKVLLLLVVSMLLGGLAAPAMAAEEPVGGQINVLFANPATYAADEPFHVLHGWSDLPANAPVGRFGFTLDVDGVDQGHGALQNTAPGLADGSWIRQWLYNFPDGMPAGDVTFTGHWFAPCAYATETLGYSEPCRTPNAMVEAVTEIHTVTFS